MKLLFFDRDTLTKHIEQSAISYCCIKTPAGLLSVLSTEKGIFKAEFVHQGKVAGFESIESLVHNTLLVAGTPFQMKVWQALLDLPAGTTVSYQQLAALVGLPKAYRAVGNAVGANPIAYLIPCHRVIKSSGQFGDYAWGAGKKALLLAGEKQNIVSERIA